MPKTMAKFGEMVADFVLKTLQKPGSSFAWRTTKKVSSAFTGAVSNAHGDKDGTLAAYPLFTCYGDLLLHVFGICNVLPVGASGTLEVGIAGNTPCLIAQETASEIAAGNVFVSATQAVGAARLVGQPFVMAGKADGSARTIIETVATTDLSAGQIDYYCMWIPLEDGARVDVA